MAVLLDYQHVEISFNGNAVVHDVSFQLHPGEILGLVGESGSGKTTLLKAAMGLLGSSGMVTKGDIWFEGKNLPDLPPKEMRRICGEKIGMIFQDCGASMSPIRTIGEQIVESLSAHYKVDVRDAKATAMELFDKLRFKDGERVWNSYPFELSGGMNQRAGIAIAMLMNPVVLMADEPTSALDPISTSKVEELALELKDRYTIVIVTHNMQQAARISDKTAFFLLGELVEMGDTERLFSTPVDKRTEDYISGRFG